MKKKEIEEMVQIFSPISKIFKDFIRLKIVIALAKSERPLSFSEILLLFGKRKNWSAKLSYHIRILEREKIITNERRLDTTTGKARSSFYALTEQGKTIAEILEEIEVILRDKGKTLPSQKDSVFLNHHLN